VSSVAEKRRREGGVPDHIGHEGSRSGPPRVVVLRAILSGGVSALGSLNFLGAEGGIRLPAIGEARDNSHNTPINYKQK